MSEAEPTEPRDPEEIDVRGIDPAEILRALYRGARAQGMGLLHFAPGDLTLEEARELIAEPEALRPGHARFDYLRGRVIKTKLEDFLKPWLYDRDNGQGAMRAVLSELLEQRDAARPLDFPILGEPRP